MKDLDGCLFLVRKKSWSMLLASFSLLTTISATAQTLSPTGAPSVSSTPISAGDTAWVLASAALVMLMTPGLAFFYGGMVRRKNVMATIMQSFFWWR